MNLRSYPTALLGILLLLSMCPQPSYAAKEPPKNDKKLPMVFTAEIKRVELFDLLTYPARIIPRINASILSESEGVIKKIYAPIGKRVKKGETLMQVVNTDPVYNYAPVEVLASVSGVISAVEVTEGSRVVKGQRLGQITDPDKLRITVEVAVSDLGAIHRDLKGALTLPGGDTQVPVRVVGVSPYVDSGTGTATAELVPAEENTHRLLPGLVGKVRFQVREHNGISLPENAVFYQGKNSFVRVIKDGKAQFTEVKLGPTRQGFVEIVDGLDENEEVVVRASTYVADGEEVNTKNLQKPATQSE